MIPPGERRRQQVLAALVEAGEGWVPGAGLAERLSSSRAAVHRHVAALRRSGVEIESGRAGYRLAPGQDPVVPLLVHPLLDPPLRGPVVWMGEVGSTNDEAARLAREGSPEGTVVGADHQTAGRGRRGKPWVGSPGQGVLVSVVLRPSFDTHEAGMLPIVAAVAVADALESLGAEGVSIAWPNDVLVGGRKIVGILCELSADHDRVGWAVVGIGVNVLPVPVVPEMRWTPTSLAELGLRPRRSAVVAALLNALGRRYADWSREGHDAALGAFAARDHLVGRRVRMQTPRGEVTGEALGLDPLGRLRLRDASGEEVAMSSGEVTGVEH